MPLTRKLSDPLWSQWPEALMKQRNKGDKNPERFSKFSCEECFAEKSSLINSLFHTKSKFTTLKLTQNHYTLNVESDIVKNTYSGIT